MNLLKTIFVLFVFICTFIPQTSGQSPKIDSLETLLAKHPGIDTLRVNLINDLAYELYNRDPRKAEVYIQESWEIASSLNYHRGKAANRWLTGLIAMRSDKKKALGYFRDALEIAEAIHDEAGMCDYLTAIGNVSKNLGDVKTSNDAHEHALQIALGLKDKRLIIKSRINLSRNMTSGGDQVGATRQLQEVIKIAEEIDDKQLLARAYTNLGWIYSRQSNYSSALEYFLSSLRLNEETNDYAGATTCLLNIAGTQLSQDDFSAALNTAQKALGLAEGKKDSVKMSLCFVSIGDIYQRMGHPEAFSYYQEALAIAKDNDMSLYVNTLRNIGSIYAAGREFEKAMENFNEALALARKADLKNAQCEVCVKIGALYLQRKRYGLAREYTQKAFDLAEKMASVELQQDCKKQLSDIYAATGDFKAAYINHAQYKFLYDSLNNEGNIRKIALVESSYRFEEERKLYEFEKSGQELEIRRQEQAILSLVAISFLILLLSFAIYWSNRLKKKVLRLEIEKMNQEVTDNQKATAVAKLKLLQNSERDAHNVKILEDIGKKAAGEEDKALRSLISDYKTQSVHSNWEEFETLFTKVNTKFLDKLNALYPDLTSNERKLCVFLKLNMSNKDIAQITLQSEEALKKSRLRLRKKLGLERSVNLATFIQSL